MSTKEKVQHTPGPWKHDSRFPASVWAGELWIVSTNVESVRKIDVKEAEANARLIAAAPEMGKELLRALAVIRQPEAFYTEGVAIDIEQVLRKAGLR